MMMMRRMRMRRRRRSIGVHTVPGRELFLENLFLDAYAPLD